jgi:LPS sulfotransferase NodH
VAFDSYIICATPRSGSTLLCDLLKETGVAGRPDSFYRSQSIADYAKRLSVAPGPDFERRYLAAVVAAGTGDTGMFGMRVMWPTMPELAERLAALFPALTTETDRLAAVFGTPRYIHLERKDKVAQAVSRARAEQSGLWHRHADGSERERVKDDRPPVYDAAQLTAFVAEAEAHNAAWEAWFAAGQIEPLRLSYEELAADPPGTLAKVLSTLGLNAGIAQTVKPRTARMADTESLSWAARFGAERDRRAH